MSGQKVSAAKQKRRTTRGLGVAVLLAMGWGAVGPAFGNGLERVNADKKGSILLYSAVEVRWSADGQLTQDTFIELSNDYGNEVWVQLQYVNGDPPADAVYEGVPLVLMERPHAGWNTTGFQIRLSAYQPTYWSAFSGLPHGVSPFTVLDPGDLPGRPDPDPHHAGDRVLRGYLLAWAVDPDGREIRWNHLTGVAVVVDYSAGAAWEYTPWAFQARGVPHGVEPLNCQAFNLESGQCVEAEAVAGQMDLDGYEYDVCPNQLMFEFEAVGATVADPDGVFPGGIVDTNLVLLPC
ncbi:MAG: hypothetical protein KJ749_01570, partial [Planctomycetes bacterium]|nr:hypothetical protein [Planctomycetota bacterium]